MSDDVATMRAWLRAAAEQLPEPVLARLLAGLSPGERMTIDEEWPIWRHGGQAEPDGEWRVWLIMAGRGFGKTRAGAEWVWARVREAEERGSAGRDGGLRIALVGGSVDEVVKVMVEGESGLLATARAGEAVLWQRSRGELRFPGGALAQAYSGGHPGKLRGPEHHFAWCDELAKWRYPAATWSNLRLGLRLGERPRIVVTTTPAPGPALSGIAAAADTRVTGGRSADNPHLPADFLAAMTAEYGGTRLGRQELDGELIEDVEGALWTRAMLEQARAAAPLPSLSAEGGRALRRVVVGVDPPAGVGGDECGIVVCGVDALGTGWVLADLSGGGLSPERWARKVAAAAEAWSAHRVVAEANNGGRMVETVLRGACVSLPVKLVHASDGKSARAEPVATLFEAGRVRLAGAFPALEDQLCGMLAGGGYAGPGKSPDRADALVWALSELMVARPAAEPRVRSL